MSNPIKRPAIPATTGVTDWESLRRFLEPVKTLLEIHEGWRGRPNVDRFVPEGEIGGLTARVSAVETATATDGVPPDPPTDMEVAAGTWGNTISWVNPEDADLYYVEIWVNTANSVSEANLAGWVTVVDQQGEAADFFHLPKDIFDDHYYWIRAVDWSGNYSTWVPTEGMGGALVEGKETVSELIDTAMEILKGSVGSYPAYSASTTYNGGERMVYAGKTYQCTADGTVGIAPDSEDPPGIDYWVRVGIVIEGEIDGVNTVGIDGALVVDQSITARTIASGQLVVTGDPLAPGKVTISGNAIHIADLNAEVTDEIDAAFAAGQILNAPGFEVGFTGWDVFGSGWAITEDAGNVFSGNQAALHDGTTGATGYIQNKEFAVDAGERYLLQMRCRAQTGADGLCRLRIKFMDEDGVTLSGGYVNAQEGLPGVDWEWWRGVVTAPAGAKKACVQVTREGPPTTGDFYVDNVMAALIPKDVDIDCLQTTNGPNEANADKTSNNSAKEIINMPQTPSGSGFFNNGTYMGFFDDGDWKTFFKNNGDFYFNSDTNNYIQWDGSALQLHGQVFRLEAGADIRFASTSTNPSWLIFEGAYSRKTFIGQKYSSLSTQNEPDFCIYPATANYNSFRVGLSTEDELKPFYGIAMHVYNNIGMYLTHDTGSSYEGQIQLRNESIWLQHDTKIIIEADDIEFHGSITFDSSSRDVGEPLTPARYVYVGSRLRFPDFTAALDITNANTGGTESGYITVVLGGVTRYIRLFSTT